MKIYIFDGDKLDFENTEARNYYDNIYDDLAYAEEIGTVEFSAKFKKENIIPILECLIQEYEGYTYAIFDDNNELMIGGIFTPDDIDDMEMPSGENSNEIGNDNMNNQNNQTMTKIYTVTEVLICDGVYDKDEVSVFTNEETAKQYFNAAVAKDKADAIKNHWQIDDSDEFFYENWKCDEYAQNHGRIKLEEVVLNEDAPKQTYSVQVPYHTYCTVEVAAANKEEAIDLAIVKAANGDFDDEIMSNLVVSGEYDVEQVKGE